MNPDTLSLQQDLIRHLPGCLVSMVCVGLALWSADWWYKHTYRSALARLSHVAPPVALRQVTEDPALRRRAYAGHHMLMLLLVLSIFGVWAIILTTALRHPLS